MVTFLEIREKEERVHTSGETARLGFLTPLAEGTRTGSLDHPRHEVRIGWWMDGEVPWQEAALSVPNLDQLPGGSLAVEALSNLRLYRWRGEAVVSEESFVRVQGR
jgi:hypothetical protein